MGPDVATLREHPAAHGTLIWPLSGVRTLVGLEHERVRDLAALNAKPSQCFKREDTYAEVSLLTKTFTTSGMLAGLYPQMLAVVMTSAAQKARVTNIGSLPSVDSTMNVEVSLLRESL